MDDGPVWNAVGSREAYFELTRKGWVVTGAGREAVQLCVAGRPFLFGLPLYITRPGGTRTRGMTVVPLFRLNGEYYGFIVGAGIFDATGS